MFAELIEKLRHHSNLSEKESCDAMTEIMQGRATPVQIAGFLVALSMKGEKLDEIVGLARTMRSVGVGLSVSVDDLFDTCGTGGDGLNTFNVSSLAALTLAACGVRMAKHGNRSVSSRSGSADLFEALGVNVSATVDVVERCLLETDFAFFFAPTFHPSMRHAGPARRELGVRTAFNLLGPLTNPAGVRRQLVGVPGAGQSGLMAAALGRLGSERAWVVHGENGLDEVSTTGTTHVTEHRQGRKVDSFELKPSDFGLPTASLESLQISEPQEGVDIARRILAGERGPSTDFVIANAAAGLVIMERAKSLKEAAEMARGSLEDGSVNRKLKSFAAVSRGER